MNREEWELAYKRILEFPVAPYLKEYGFSDEELSIIPAQTLGELAEVNIHDLYDKMDFFNHHQLLYTAQKIKLLPTIAECALTGEWEDFSIKVQVMYETMPEAFYYFYEDMPEEYRHDFVVSCYQSHGDSLEDCREALRELPPNGLEELPEEYRNLAELTVYRAGEEPIDEAEGYFSWTLDESVARFFKDRFPFEKRHLYRAHIKPSDVIAYTDDREEKEVIQYMSVYDVEEMETL